MTELHYGKNVENLLHELSQYDSDDIGYFDVCGEDEDGREGYASVDISLLASDALKVIDALQAQVNALAAENAALKEIVDGVNSELYGKGFEVAGWHLNGAIEPLDNWFTDNGWGVPGTPATDAAIREIGAKAVEGFRSLIEHTDGMLYADSIKATLSEYAATLRNGEQGGDHA